MDSSPQQKVDWLIIVEDQIKGTLLQQMYDVLQSLQSSSRQLKDSAAAGLTVEDDDPAIDSNVLEHLRLAQMLKKRVEDTMFIDAAIQEYTHPNWFGIKMFFLAFQGPRIASCVIDAVWRRHVRQEPGRSSGCDS